ncbi:MAG: cation diffusion facilitator family transporter [Nitrososphaerales archaeon]
MEGQKRQSLSIRAVNLGLVANIVLALLKVTVGIAGKSAALLADGINSTSDVAYYVVVRIFMQMARKPADREHPYGHTQLESIAALVVGAFVITTAVAIFWDAVNKVYALWSGQATFEGAAPIALAVALSTVAVKVGLMLYTRRVGKVTGNLAVAALAKDHRNDIFAASGAALGIFLSLNGLAWGDPLAGAVVALLVLRTGIAILSDASAELMDTVPGDELARQVQELLADVPGVMCVEEVYAHRFGPYMVMNVTVGIDGSLSVSAGDSIASAVERRLYERIELLRRVHVHYHPEGITQLPEPGQSPKNVIDSD